MATKPIPANDSSEGTATIDISPISKELVVGLVGHAGAGASTAGIRIQKLLEDDYEIHRIKFSDLISEIDGVDVLEVDQGAQEGRQKFARASDLQNRGDQIRKSRGNFALAVAAVAKIQTLRDGRQPGIEKIAFILDSIKHPEEVELLRTAYAESFRLVAVHCDQDGREKRLIGDKRKSSAKFAGQDDQDVIKFMERDSKDSANEHGQRVRDVFHLADFFLDNSTESENGSGMSDDIERFIDLILGNGVVRPTRDEKGMYLAFAAALKSSCLSRQVGAALTTANGEILATGSNDPPKFGGGVYDEDSDPDYRCMSFAFEIDGGLTFTGCHNDRKKKELYAQISDWSSENISEKIAMWLAPKEMIVGSDAKEEEREFIAEKIRAYFRANPDAFRGMPGVKDAIEYSRSIHAEMDALISAARIGNSTKNASIYVTTYPCHNCARHLVAAGVKRVLYVEPYTKSLALELHSDSISADATGDRETHMLVVPFTGVGPRMYYDFFVKRNELKDSEGNFRSVREGLPFSAVRLRELDAVEKEVVKLLPSLGD